MNKNVTLTWLEDQGACNAVKEWFAKHYPNGVGHRELYAALQPKHKGWGYWLLGRIGKAEFAIRCALWVYKEPTWVEWATRWLSGEDRTAATAAAAAAAADRAAADADRAAARVAVYAAAATDRAATYAAAAAAADRAAADWAATADPTIDLLALLDECEEREKVNE